MEEKNEVLLCAVNSYWVGIYVNTIFIPSLEAHVPIMKELRKHRLIFNNSPLREFSYVVLKQSGSVARTT